MNMNDGNDNMEFLNAEDFEHGFDGCDFSWDYDIYPDKKYIGCLQKIFGHKNFRKSQWQIISSIINEKRDNCAIMTTGYGKSLCYQFPSVYLKTVTLVVSPLISVMEDQVLSLQLLNIRACFLGTAQKDKSILEKVMNFEYTLVYLTPEFITGVIGFKLLETLSTKLSLIAIDEAHCISKWGHGFRKSFCNLGNIRKIVPRVPILAITATATERIKSDIIASLHLKNPQIVCTGFDRSNLEFNIHYKSSDVWNDIGNILVFERGSTIVYCLTRSSTEKIAAVIRNHGLPCESYHAGMSINRRKEIHRRFVRDEIQIIIATIAFGMGIDKPDVRCIIHYGVCQDIESYYQEIGRAGRDGLPAKCFLFYSMKDFEFHKYMRNKERHSHEIKQYFEELTDKMFEYVSTTGCRRQFILNYFVGNPVKNAKNTRNCCDNCRKSTDNIIKGTFTNKYQNLDENGFYDFTTDGYLLLQAIEVFNGHTGLRVPILFLHGSKDKKIQQERYSHPLYGAGKHKHYDWWKSLADLLLMNKYIEQHMLRRKLKTTFISYTVQLSQKSHDWLNSAKEREPLKLKLSQNMYQFLKSESVSNSTVNKNFIICQSKTNRSQELLKALYKIRTSLSSKLDVMPYMIVSNIALHQLKEKRPLTIDELKKYEIDGFSEKKIKELGPHFVKCIVEFEKYLSPAEKKKESNEKSIQHSLQLHPLFDVKLTEIHFRISELWANDKDIKQISQIIGLAETTTTNYLFDLMKCGNCITKKDLKRLGITTTNFNIITSRLPQDNNLEVNISNINKTCPTYITANMIKYVLIYHRIRHHLKSLEIDFSDPDVVKNDDENTDVTSTKENVQQSEHNLCTESKESSDTLLENIDSEARENKQFENENYWESYIDIDYEEIDKIEKANVSNINNFDENNIRNNDKKEKCKISTEISETVDSDKYHEEISDIDQNELTQTAPIKRKLPLNLKTNRIVYDDTGESDDEHTNQDTSQTNTKRRIPQWLTSSSTINIKRKSMKLEPKNIFR